MYKSTFALHSRIIGLRCDNIALTLLASTPSDGIPEIKIFSIKSGNFQISDFSSTFFHVKHNFFKMVIVFESRYYFNGLSLWRFEFNIAGVIFSC